MSKIYFNKNYERDVSLIIEALWAQKLVGSLRERLGLEAAHLPFIVFYVTTDNMQIWENNAAISWYQDRLMEAGQKNASFFDDLIAEYGELLKEVEVYWKAGPTADKDALKRYLILAGEALSLFCMWYYPLIDERTPEEMLAKLEELRGADEFFARNDLFVKDCVEALGGRRELANFLMPEEFPELPPEEVLLARTKGIVSADGTINHVGTLDEFASSHPEYVFEGLFDKIGEVSELKGQAAFRGVKQGRVRVVKNKQQMQIFEACEIMVSPMTTPDFLPAMKKAAAFVTDEGGVTCHAAIVARELKKPCIIGTKVATKALKDGDLVEVDADKGVVMILKRA